MKNTLIGAAIGAAVVAGGFMIFSGDKSNSYAPSPSPKAANPFDIGTSVSVGGDKDCADFKTQRDAQSFFEANDPANDPHRLDRDSDGEVCETLP